MAFLCTYLEDVSLGFERYIPFFILVYSYLYSLEANFETSVIKDLCNLTRMRISRTKSVNPQGNEMCEKFNKTLLSILGTQKSVKKRKAYGRPLLYYYTSTSQASTGYCPYLLMFGRNPRLPIDDNLV